MDSNYYEINILNEKMHYLNSDQQMLIIMDLKRRSERASRLLDNYGMPQASGIWPDHEIELSDFSEHYPDVIFELTVWGLETNYRNYYKAGYFQVCSFIPKYENYDPKFLRKYEKAI